MTCKHFPLAVTRLPASKSGVVLLPRDSLDWSALNPNPNPIPQPIVRTRSMFGCTVKILSTGKVNVYNGKTSEYLGFFILPKIRM